MLRTCALLLLLLLGGGESALAERTIVCATSANLPPMAFVDAEDNIAGFTIDLLRAVGRIAGFKAEFKIVKADTLVEGLQAGQYDAICSTAFLDEEARKSMDISSPFHIANQVLVVNQDTRIDSTTSMRGLSIGVLAGGTAQPQGARIKVFNDVTKAMEGLYVKKLDGVICDDTVAAYFASVIYQNRLKVTGYLGQRDTRISYGVAVKKGDKEALALLNQGISTVQAREIDKELRMKWFAR